MQKFAIGSYTSSQGHAPDARGRGLSIIGIEKSIHPLSIRELGVFEKLENPAYLTWNQRQNLLYATSEAGSGPGRVDMFSLDSNHIPEKLSGCRGNNHDACHISLSIDGSKLFTASYGAGQVTAFTLNSHGEPQQEDSIIYTGHGPNKARQESPHAHQIVSSPYTNHIYVCDLGTDTIWIHRNEYESFTNEGNQPRLALKLPEGYGPRHLAFHKSEPIVYILCELVPRIVTARINREDGSLKMIQEISSTGEEMESSSPPAPAAIKIHPSGKTLAVSNRFRDTIAVFMINNEEGKFSLSFSGEYSCGGKTPRDIEFDLDGSLLLIANQDSHNITSLNFIPDSGLYSGEAGPEIETGSPVCIIRL